MNNDWYQLTDWRRDCDLDDAIENLGAIYYGDMNPNKDGKYVEMPHCTFSDYSGCLVQRSNYEWMLENYKDNENIHRIYGGYGTAGILFSIEYLESDNELQDIVNMLFDYPVIDDEKLSELELQIDEESWNDYIKSYIVRQLDNVNYNYNEDNLQGVVYNIMDKINEYFIHEDSNSSYLDIDKIIKYMLENESSYDFLIRKFRDVRDYLYKKIYRVRYFISWIQWKLGKKF